MYSVSRIIITCLYQIKYNEISFYMRLSWSGLTCDIVNTEQLPLLFVLRPKWRAKFWGFRNVIEYWVLANDSQHALMNDNSIVADFLKILKIKFPMSSYQFSSVPDHVKRISSCVTEIFLANCLTYNWLCWYSISS